MNKQQAMTEEKSAHKNRKKSYEIKYVICIKAKLIIYKGITKFFFDYLKFKKCEYQ
jgi:hypothetical protein